MMLNRMRSFRSPGAALHQTRLERNAEGAMAVPEARPGEADPVSLGHRGGIEAQPLAFEGPMDGDREVGVDEGVAGMVQHHGQAWSRRPFAPAGVTSARGAGGAMGTGRRKSKVSRASAVPSPASPSIARASSAAGGPPC